MVLFISYCGHFIQVLSNFIDTLLIFSNALFILYLSLFLISIFQYFRISWILWIIFKWWIIVIAVVGILGLSDNLCHLVMRVPPVPLSPHLPMEQHWWLYIAKIHQYVRNNNLHLILQTILKPILIIPTPILLLHTKFILSPPITFTSLSITNNTTHSLPNSNLLHNTFNYFLVYCAQLFNYQWL